MTRKLARLVLLAAALSLAPSLRAARAQEILPIADEIPSEALGAFHATDVNAWGLVTGQYGVSLGPNGVLRFPDGSTRVLRDFGFTAYPGISNDTGLTVGFARHSSDGMDPQLRATLWVADEVIDLGGPRPAPVVSHVTALNDAGQIIGYASYRGQPEVQLQPGGCVDGYVWTLGRDATLTTLALPTLGGCVTQPTGINDRGEVAGTSTDAVGARRAFRWTAESGIRDLGTLPGGRFSRAHKINELGQIVGVSEVLALGQDGVPAYQEHAFVWSESGGMRDLGTFPGGRNSYPVAINARGHVLGRAELLVDDFVVLRGGPARWASHPFLWTPEDGMIDLDPDPTHGWLHVGPIGFVGGTWYPSLGAVALNDRDEVIGKATAPSGWGGGPPMPQAFYWSRETGAVQLPTRSGFASVYDLNDDGMIVGDDYTAIAWYVRPPVTPPVPTYEFVGFAPPLLNDGTATFELGRKIPVEFKLVSWGFEISSATPALHVYRVEDGAVGTADLAPRHAQLAWQRKAGYAGELRTHELGPGTFLLRVDLPEGFSREVRFTVLPRK